MRDNDIYRQVIRNSFIMKNAWEDWAPYRNNLTELVLSLKPESVMIIGGGRCNDIDLRRLLMVVNKVTIIDVDADGMQEAVSALPEGMQKNVECRTASLTGIEEEQIADFCEAMMAHARAAVNGNDISFFTESLRELLDEMEGRLIRSESELEAVLPEGATDVVLCSGVHSQLFSTLMMFLKMLFGSVRDYLPGLDGFETEVENRVRHMNDVVIPVIDKVVFRAAAKAAVFGNEYMPDNPVEGADQCIRDLREYYAPKETHLIWEFNRAAGKTYDMLIQICPETTINY